MSSKTFSVGNYVVYPSHGVGKITDIKSQSLANLKIEMYCVYFEKEKMTLSVPVSHAGKVGLRSLCSAQDAEDALDVIGEKAQTARGIMWSRRAQEYERKINSGDIIAISEVIRDLHRNVGNPDRSYSERVIYEAAYERFVTEASIVKKVTREAFEEQFGHLLKVNQIIPENDMLEEQDEDEDDDYDDDNSGGEAIAA